MRRGLVTFLLVVSVATLGLANAASASDTNLVLNGNFSSPDVGPGGLGYFITGQSFPHWRVVGAVGNVAVTSKTFIQNGYTLSPTAPTSSWISRATPTPQRE